MHGLRSANALMQQVMFIMRIAGPSIAILLVGALIVVRNHVNQTDGTSDIETRIASHFSITSDVPIKTVRMESLENHAQALREENTLPIGTVEFIRKAMSLAGIAEPPNFSYPETLRRYLHRTLNQRPAGAILGHWFIKPIMTKTFTGFAFDISLGNPDHLSFHDRDQYNVFLSLPPETPVWISEPVTWLSEFRYYVIEGEVRGEGRYDDAPDETPAPDIAIVKEMARACAGVQGAAAAFSLDVGVLDTGETALVECNDAWALGYYKGTLSHRDYILMLWKRWEQLIKTQRKSG